MHDPYGDHTFQCKFISKMHVHSSIRNGFALMLTPALSTAGYLHPTSTFDIEPMLYLPSDPSAWPFDLAFHPGPALPPSINHACAYTTTVANITISSPPPWLTFLHDSPDVIQILLASTDSHCQVYEKWKLKGVTKWDQATGIATPGDNNICDVFHKNMSLLPFAINPFGWFSPILQTISPLT
jgi:hypothetical protein